MAQYRSAACACLALVPFAGVAGWESLEKVVTPGGWDFEHRIFRRCLPAETIIN